MAEEFHQKLSFREKAGYGFGDAAANFVFQTMLIFQLGFYTDTFGITAAAAGTLLLVGRFWDAFFDPFMGVVADRTNTRWGKFRPWVLWSAIPFAVMFTLTFTTPHFGGTAKLIYAYVTYFLLMTVYSVNNLPYSALNGVMTADVDEHTSLSSYRFFFAMAAAFVVQGLTLPMVSKFGHGDNAKGWSMTDRSVFRHCHRFLRDHLFQRPRTRHPAARPENVGQAGLRGPVEEQAVDFHVRADALCFHHAGDVGHGNVLLFYLLREQGRHVRFPAFLGLGDAELLGRRLGPAGLVA